MSRFLVGVVLVVLTAACSVSEEDWLERAPTAYCDYYQTCDPPFYGDQAECEEEVEGDIAPDSDCAFDPDAARACLDALDGLQCRGSASNVPGSCDTIYVCE